MVCIKVCNAGSKFRFLPFSMFFSTLIHQNEVSNLDDCCHLNTGQTEADGAKSMSQAKVSHVHIEDFSTFGF